MGVNGFIKSGNYEDEPAFNDIYETMLEINEPVFMFYDIEISESIVSSTKWGFRNISGTLVKNKSNYPAIKLIPLNQGSNNDQIELTCDFDTGALENFINEKIIESILPSKELNIYEKISYGRIVINEEENVYHTKPLRLRFTINCQKGIQEVQAVFKCIEEWQNSFWTRTYPSRQSLIGRNFLIKNKLSIIIDGENQTTSIL